MAVSGSSEPNRKSSISEQHVTIYTDGGASPNPGRGGYAAILLCKGRRKELSGAYQLTTNNRMEILAAIRGLEALQRACRVTLYTDSKYLVDSMTKGWARKWWRNNWMRTRTEKARNKDLWARLLELCELHEVDFRWVRGHADDKENNRCDALVAVARKRAEIAVDEGFMSC